MRHSRSLRWLVVMVVVLAVHAAIFAGLMQWRSASSVPQTNGIEVQAETSSAAVEQGGEGAKNPAAESVNTTSSAKPTPAASSQTMAKNTDIHTSQQANALTNTASSGVQPHSPAENNGERQVGATASGEKVGANINGNRDAPSGRVSGGLSAGASAGSASATGAAAVDCAATLKPPNGTVAGLDVLVWVERSSDGVRFAGLVNQSGEGSRYLREIRAAVAGVRFVAHDAQCVGKKVKLKVRISS